ncbi:nitroreductase family protein [Crenobacter cavernae]|uniref:Nitroreductase domain-containing protein n=1 Tax=Crenobacter cavernae TaxID=2290923 RepID=A0A345Y953_9NEIS|nr:hypothetical protein DWG20_14010 [Crenobacter cavernae]
MMRLHAKRFFLQEVHRKHPERGGHTFERLQETDSKLFYNADTVIILCGRSAEPFVVADCRLAAKNLMLAARAMGLGSCVMGSAVAGLNSPEWKARRNVPRSHRLSSACPPSRASRAPGILKWK